MSIQLNVNRMPFTQPTDGVASPQAKSVFDDQVDTLVNDYMAKAMDANRQTLRGGSGVWIELRRMVDEAKASPQGVSSEQQRAALEKCDALIVAAGFRTA